VKKSEERSETSAIGTARAASSLAESIRTHAFSILSISFGLAAIMMILGSTLASNPPRVVGENLVLIEVQILPNFYMKPITFFMFALFLSFAFGLNTGYTRRWFASISASKLRFIYIIAWLIALGSGFEVVYHIVLWSAALAVQGLSNPDLVVNPWPQSTSPINVVFASKIVVMILVMSLFLIDYIRRIDRTRTAEALIRRISEEMTRSKN